MKKILILILFVILSNFSLASDYWKQPLHSISTSSIIANGSDVFIGTWYGIYSTTNNGESWIAKSNGLTSYKIISLVTDGINIFAGTNDAGVFRTTDNGENWFPVNNGLNSLDVKYLEIIDSKLFVVCYSEIEGIGGIFKSSDYGENWIKVTTGLSDYRYPKMCAFGNDIYLCTGVSSGGIIVSKDFGENWSIIGSTLPEYTSVSCLAINDSLIFAGLAYDGIYCSSNNGESWTAINTGLPCLEINYLGIINNKIYADVSGEGLYVSSNNGESWENVKFGDFIFFMKFLNSMIEINGVIWAGSVAGVFQSTDDGVTWKGINSGLISSNTYCLLIDDSNVYCGSNNGIFKSTDEGNSWVKINKEYDSIYGIRSIVKSGDKMFVGCYYQGVFKSLNNGKSWSKMNTGITDTTVTCLIQNKGKMYLGTWEGTIYFSEDDGNSWEKINMVQSHFPTYNRNITLAIKDSLIIAGTLYGLYTTTNGGEFWELTTKDDIQYINTLSLAVDGDDIFIGTANGIYKTSDNGDIWTPLNSGMEGIEVTRILIHNSYIFAGTKNNGVYLSIDKGVNWKTVNAGLYTSNINDIAISDSIIYVATDGAGVYTANLSELIISDIKEDINLSDEVKLFPNPACDKITIILSEDKIFSSISIVNSIGIQVKKFENAEIFGTNSIYISTNDLPVGLYYCIFESNTGKIAKSFIVMK